MSEALIGVIIGSLSAILGGIVGSIITYYFEVKRDNRNETKVTYELIEKIIHSWRKVSKKAVTLSDEVVEKYSELFDQLAPKLMLYCKPAVFKLWLETMKIKNDKPNDYFEDEVFRENIRLLSREMRNDLGVKNLKEKRRKPNLPCK